MVEHQNRYKPVFLTDQGRKGLKVTRKWLKGASLAPFNFLLAYF